MQTISYPESSAIYAIAFDHSVKTRQPVYVCYRSTPDVTYRIDSADTVSIHRALYGSASLGGTVSAQRRACGACDRYEGSITQVFIELGVPFQDMPQPSDKVMLRHDASAPLGF